MSVLRKYVLTKHAVASKSIFKIVHRSMVCKKDKHGWRNIDNENDLNSEIYITNRTDEFIEVVILDQNDDTEELRRKNEHISEKRIPLGKRQSLKTPLATLSKKLEKKKVNKKINSRNVKNPSLDADLLADQYYELMDGDDSFDNLNNKDDRNDPEDPDGSGISLHSPTIASEREQTSPLSRRDHILQQNEIAHSLNNSGKMTATNSKKIEQVRRGLVTKDDLNEALERHADRIRASNKENDRQAAEPDFTADHKIFWLNWIKLKKYQFSNRTIDHILT